MIDGIKIRIFVIIIKMMVRMRNCFERVLSICVVGFLLCFLR